MTFGCLGRPSQSIPEVHINWTSAPDDFLVPIGVALEAAVTRLNEDKTNHSSADDGEEVLVLNISMEKRQLAGRTQSGRARQRSKIHISETERQGDINMVAYPNCIIAPLQSVLDTAVGRMLNRRQLLRWTLCLPLIVFMALSATNRLSHYYIELDDTRGGKVSLEVYGFVGGTVRSALCLLYSFLLLHLISPWMLRLVVMKFDFLMIVGSQLCGVMAIRLQTFTLLYNSQQLSRWYVASACL